MDSTESGRPERETNNIDNANEEETYCNPSDTVALLSTKKSLNNDNLADSDCVFVTNDGERVSYEDALEVIGYGLFHYILLFVCGLAVAADAIEIQAVSFILPSACDLHLTDTDKGWLTAIIFVGMMIGGYVWGALADIQGRRSILRYAMFVNGLFALASGFTPNFGFFLFCRFMSGVGVGGSMPVVFSYFSEFQTASRRGTMITILACFWMLGNILAAGLAWLVIPHHIGGQIGTIFFGSWRIFVSLCSIPCFTVAIALFFLPESPRFLLEMNRAEDALKALDTVDRINKRCRKSGVYLQEQRLQLAANSSENIVDNNNDESSLKVVVYRGRDTIAKMLSASIELFRQPYLKRTLILLNIWFTFSFSYYGLWLWFPELFQKFADGSSCSNRITVNHTTTPPPCVDNSNSTEIFFETFLTSISTLPGNIFTVLLIDKIGRKIILSGSMLSSGIAVFFIWLVNQRQETVILSCIFSGLSIGGWNALDVLGPEMYPTHLRSTAFGLQSVLGRIASILGNLVFAQLIDVDCAIPILIVAIFLAWGAISTIGLPNTTKIALT